MQQTPLVSISVVTYQHKNYIKQCLDGILMQQTNFHFEIILGEDESKDGTREICKEYVEKNPDKIKLFLRSRKDVIYINGNATGRFNFMENLKACQGKYIALCEGDDYWTDPLKLQKQVDFLKANKDYSLCFHPCEILRVENNIQKLIKQNILDVKYEYTFQNLLQYWNIPTAAIVFKNNPKINNLPDWFCEVASGDIALIMLLFEEGKFKCLEDVMSVYRINNGVSKSHISYRMIHYRAKLYFHLNEYFNYKYEKEIYDALNFIYLKHSGTKPKLKPKPKKTLYSKIKKKAYKIIKKSLNYKLTKK